MSCKPYLIVLFAFAALNMAFAQEAFKAEPTHYKLDFENENVQVVNVHYGPHEKSSLHSHPGGVVVVLTAGHLKFTDEHGNVREVHALPGEARWFPPLKHKVENLGDTPYNAVYIGIKMDKKSGAINGKNGQLAMDAKTRELVAQALSLKKQ
jgi:quercetin dioxygenase-like cupin family protein